MTGAEFGKTELKHGRVMRRETYKFKRRPYKHQHRAVRAALPVLKASGGFALLMEPRTGKTKVAIDLASILHQAGKLNRVVIVCPLSVMGVWQDEIELNCPFPHRVLVWDRKARKQRRLPAYGRNVIDFVIVNYDAFGTVGQKSTRSNRRTKRGGRYAVRRALMNWQPQMMILDESHRIKKPSAKRTQSIRMVAEGGHYSLPAERKTPVPYRLILTGTPQTGRKKVTDLYSQWKFMNPESPLVKKHDARSFKAEYGLWRDRSWGAQWIRAKNTKKLMKLVHREAFATTRAECYDLPPRREQVIHVDLTGHTAEVYAEMAEEMIARIKTGEITEASIRLVQTLRLAQITGGVAKTTPTDQHPEARLLRIGRDKLRTFDELVTDLFEAGEKIVCAARFRADIAAMASVCKKHKVPWFELHGGIKPRDRDPERKQFQAMQGPAVFIMQPQAGALGIDLSSASIFIWYSLTNSWVDYSQAMDRIALSPRATTYMYLLARGTVDEVMYDNLIEDGDVGKAILKRPESLWEPDRLWTPSR